MSQNQLKQMRELTKIVKTACDNNTPAPHEAFELQKLYNKFEHKLPVGNSTFESAEFWLIEYYEAKNLG